MVIGVLAVVVTACAALGEPSSSVGGAGSATTETASLPGQTDVGGGEVARSTVTLVDDQNSVVGDESGSTSSIETLVEGSNESPLTSVGAAVLARQGFLDFSQKRVGLIASRASVVDGKSTIDLFAEADGVDLTALFAPEHGIRAEAGAGADIDDEIDPVTGLPVFSLYGTTKRPTADQLAGIDVLVFDLQDVGTRFYTYTATMGLAMQAAAEQGVPFVVLDRPNPLGGITVDGALRDDDQVSFVSQYPIPAVHGMTAGELALAIKGEGWLDGLESLDLRVIELDGWNRARPWDETGLRWIAPSPGLPTTAATAAYPAVVLFEATTLSFGRGTDYPFSQIGAPWLDAEALAAELNGRGIAGVRFDPVRFTPVSLPAASDPPFEGEELPGVRLEVTDPGVARMATVGLHLLSAVLAQAETATPPIEVIDRAAFFDLLTGSAAVRRSLLAGEPAESIVASWEDELAAFDAVRTRYLLY